MIMHVLFTVLAVFDKLFQERSELRWEIVGTKENKRGPEIQIRAGLEEATTSHLQPVKEEGL